jgi:import inner membrane translocase subunit TIM21
MCSTKGRGPEVEEETTAIILTPYQKVQQGVSTGFWLGILVLATGCAFFIGRELFPSRWNPNALFSEALTEVLADVEIATRLGTPIKGYGRDHGGHREGRRNFISNVEMPADEGCDKSMRVKFNIEGPRKRHAYVYASVTPGMQKGEWLYLIVQVTATGEVFTLHDTRHESHEAPISILDQLKGLTGSSSE